MKIAISGSTGFIGTALLAKLAERNVQLLLLRRPSGSDSSTYSVHGQVPIESAQSTCSMVAWDPIQGVEDPKLLEGLDAIIHLAGRSVGKKRWTTAEKALLRQSRVDATAKLVEQLSELRAKPKILISAAATGVYGSCGDRWLSESSPRGQGFLADMAVDWELASQPLLQFGVRLAYARFGIVLDPSGGALAKMRTLFRWGVGGVLGNGRQMVSWISLQDCVRGILHLLDHEQCAGPFNFVSPNPVSNRQLTELLGKILHRPTFFPAPAFALRLALGEMASELLLSSCRVRPDRLLECGFQFDHPELSEFLQLVL